MDKILIILLFLTSIFILSCDSPNDNKCKEIILIEMSQYQSKCSDPNYLSDHDYLDYDDCMHQNFFYASFACVDGI